MELAVPITIFWDLPVDLKDNSLLRRIAAEIITCRPLMLQLRGGDNNSSNDLPPLLELFRETPIAVSLTIPRNMFVDPAYGKIASSCKEVLLDCEHLDQLREDIPAGYVKWESTLDSCRPILGLSFSLCQGNWRELAGLVQLCVEHGIKRLVLPMQRLYGAGEAFYLDREEQMELTAALASVGGVEGMNITIHDPFIWRAFYPGLPFPQGGGARQPTPCLPLPRTGVSTPVPPCRSDLVT